MAKASWALVNPSQGSGNKTVNVSSDGAHTGRELRSTVLTITAANVTPVNVTVNQAGKPAYVQNNSDTATAAKAGQNVTISGTANSKKLSFTLGNGDLNISLPSTYTAASLSTTNGAEISGDPGAIQEYNWSIVLTVPANAGTTELSRQIIVTDEGGNTDTCVLTQAAGSATLTVNKDVIELDYQGTAQSLTITSNTSWTIS